MPTASDPSVPLTAERSPWLRGPLQVPGEPAMARLALLLAALGRGPSRVENAAGGGELTALAAALTRFGAATTRQEGVWHVDGTGGAGLLAPDGALDGSGLGEAAPLLLALLASLDFDSRIAMLALGPLSEAVLEFGGRNGTLVQQAGDELLLRGPRFTIPLDLALPPGAQALQAPLLLQALLTVGRSTLRLPPGDIDPAIGLLAAFGAGLTVDHTDTGTRIDITGRPPLQGRTLAVPGDPVLAAYPAVAALLSPDSEVTIPGVALTPGRFAIFDALQLLGGDVRLEPSATGDSTVTDLRVAHSRLIGTTIPAALAIAPEDRVILTIAAAHAEGETMIEGMEEGHRRLALTRALRDNGIDCEEREGGLLVRGQARVPGGGKVAVRLDPKLAMSFLVLGMVAEKPVTIDDGGVMNELFGDFASRFEHIGASFSQ